MGVRCCFASDLHGRLDRYEKLFGVLAAERPDALFLGGDLLPGGPGEGLTSSRHPDFWNGFLAPRLEALRTGGLAPRVFLILGNDDARFEEAAVLDLAVRGLLEYLHGRRLRLDRHLVAGYACVPPTPFRLKDWERYDVSRFVDPGCLSPEEGVRSVPVDGAQTRWGTIAGDLEELLPGGEDLSEAVLLFHTPPYRTLLDRAALDGQLIDHVPVDPHVGSIAVRRFLEVRQPLLSLHGHVHESPRLTGRWCDRLGRTHCLSAAHDGPELALVRFDLDDPCSATRELL